MPLSDGTDGPDFSEDDYLRGMERLLQAVQELSLARSLGEIQRIVRHSARDVVGCAGITFVLRDDDMCYYADEDAIAPLWKGSRFAMAACVSGWVMLNGTAAVIPDIYLDPRVPHEAYRPTFVKSLVMVPIRRMRPVGAIGAYWATERDATPREVALLQALADSTSIAMENIQLYAQLEQRVRDRTAALERATTRFGNSPSPTISPASTTGAGSISWPSPRYAPPGATTIRACLPISTSTDSKGSTTSWATMPGTHSSAMWPRCCGPRFATPTSSAASAGTNSAC
jgi:hypothetical protein